ncbi:hypothetical protein SFRURICE_020011 [Spodoptera frugiperda]|nr:hypothetical protein SFRURICE_020011 [Spodoptera frugiperda]
MQTRNAGGHRLTGVHRSLPAPAPLRRRCVRKQVHLIIRKRSAALQCASRRSQKRAKIRGQKKRESKTKKGDNIVVRD